MVIEVGGERLRMQAATAEGTERPPPVGQGRFECYPNVTKYQEGVTRELPVVVRPTS
jgi:F420H(2)-dependent quinone reductase